MNQSLKLERDDTARRLQDLTAELSTEKSSKEETAINLKRSEDAVRRKEKECMYPMCCNPSTIVTYPLLTYFMSPAS